MLLPQTPLHTISKLCCWFVDRANYVNYWLFAVILQQKLVYYCWMVYVVCSRRSTVLKGGFTILFMGHWKAPVLSEARCLHRSWALVPLQPFTERERVLKGLISLSLAKYRFNGREQLFVTPANRNLIGKQLCPVIYSWRIPVVAHTDRCVSGI